MTHGTSVGRAKNRFWSGTTIQKRNDRMTEIKKLGETTRCTSINPWDLEDRCYLSSEDTHEDGHKGMHLGRQASWDFSPVSVTTVSDSEGFVEWLEWLDEPPRVIPEMKRLSDAEPFDD